MILNTRYFTNYVIPLLLATTLTSWANKILRHPDELLSLPKTSEKIATYYTNASKVREKKDWTVIIYMAADNDLRSFAIHNLRQMTDIGSTEFCNIFVHLDIRIANNQKITRRYLVEKDKLTHVGPPDQPALDSGNPETLISCCQTAMSLFPADHYALIFWDHGTGYVEPTNNQSHSSRLFKFNPYAQKFILDRSLHEIYTQQTHDDTRGICWDSSTGNYLTNQKLDYALNTISEKILGSKKFDLIGFDACLMNMLEIASMIKNYSQVMVGSQEVELAVGWKYDTLFEPFIDGTMSNIALAKHIVYSFASTYEKLTNDYTQAAITLDENLENLEQNVHDISLILIEAIKKQQGKSVQDYLFMSHLKGSCTRFHNHNYVDLYDFYENLEKNMYHIKLTDKNRDAQLKDTLKKLLEKGKRCINQVVIANASGKNLPRAHGISIYFPEKSIHYSYHNSHFALINGWYKLISLCAPHKGN